MKIKQNVFELLKIVFPEIQNAIDFQSETEVEISDPKVTDFVLNGYALVLLIDYTLKVNKNTLKYVFVDFRKIKLMYNEKVINQEHSLLNLSVESIQTLYNIDKSVQKFPTDDEKKEQSIFLLLEIVAEKMKLGQSIVLEPSTHKNLSRFGSNDMKSGGVGLSFLQSLSKNPSRVSIDKKSVSEVRMNFESKTINDLISNIICNIFKIKKKAVRLKGFKFIGRKRKTFSSDLH